VRAALLLERDHPDGQRYGFAIEIVPLDDGDSS
jgi:hypothetical protein